MMIGSGCATEGVSVEGVRDVLDPLVTAHATALAKDGGSESVKTGRTLIATYDCVMEEKKCAE